MTDPKFQSQGPFIGNSQNIRGMGSIWTNAGTKITIISVPWRKS